MSFDTCPKCGARALIASGYLEAGSDATLVRAHCTGCGYVWVEDLADLHVDGGNAA